MEVVGLVIGAVSLFGQGYGAFKRYRRKHSTSKNARTHSTNERSLKKTLKKAGPTVQVEYNKMFEQLGDILALHKDKDVQIEILTHHNTFLQNVLFTLKTAVSAGGGRNPLDFVVLERHTMKAQTGILNSLRNVAMKVSTPSPRPPPVPAPPKLQIFAKCVLQFPEPGWWMSNCSNIQRFELDSTEPGAELVGRMKMVLRAGGASDAWVKGSWARVILNPIGVRKGAKDLREGAPKLREKKSLKEQGITERAMVFFYHPKEFPDGPKCSPTELKDRVAVCGKYGIWD